MQTLHSIWFLFLIVQSHSFRLNQALTKELHSNIYIKCVRAACMSCHDTLLPVLSYIACPVPLCIALTYTYESGISLYRVLFWSCQHLRLSVRTILHWSTTQMFRAAVSLTGFLSPPFLLASLGRAFRDINTKSRIFLAALIWIAVFFGRSSFEDRGGGGGPPSGPWGGR